MKRYFNIHKHDSVSEDCFVEVLNLAFGFDQIASSGLYSVGIHPWYLKAETVEAEWTLLEKISRNSNVLAIGECGLDKACDTDWILQEQWFIKQIEWAKQIQKPLIIHCVRAFEEVLSILKNQGPSVPVIFHGFNKSIELAQKILNQGYFVSFGRHISESRSLQEVLRQTPADKLFLETDAAPVSIAEVYRAAAAVRNVDLEALSLQIEENASLIFGVNIFNKYE